ncbi:hypothetical protein P692DRAFT_20724237 [Suillus brevipes Sb2]|nr:hypothetical protein P692DRAFT_20724237 [Suillus brevipes Sb2]
MPPDCTRVRDAVNGLQRECQRAKLTAQVSNRVNAVLELDETGQTLCIWYWPVQDDGGRVSPAELVAHQNSHQFRGPHCLCAFVDNCYPPGHCEAAIVMLTRGQNAGEYLACCTLSKCGYVVFMEQMHVSPGLPVKHYPRRGSDQPRPREVAFLDGNDIKLVDIMQRRQLRKDETHKTFDRLLKLDSFSRPGLTDEEFRRFLTQCCGCQLIMTRRMFERHDCLGKEDAGEVEVIDLTTEDD